MKREKNDVYGLALIILGMAGWDSMPLTCTVLIGIGLYLTCVEAKKRGMWM